MTMAPISPFGPQCSTHHISIYRSLEEATRKYVHITEFDIIILLRIIMILMVIIIPPYLCWWPEEEASSQQLLQG
jgi:hypothetical protein